MTWQADALCRGAYGVWDEELGDAVEYGPGAAVLNAERQAEKIFNAKCGCAICPVQTDCLLEAISGPYDPFRGSVAGGLTTAERIPLRPISSYDQSHKAKVARGEQSVDTDTAHPLEPAGTQPEHAR
jgi:hypothetical protein